MKKLLFAILLAGLVNTNLLAGWVTGTVHEVSAREDGTMWVSMHKTNDALTNLYKINATGDALKTIQAAVLSAKMSSSPVRMLWISSAGGVWTRIDFLP